MDFWKDYEKRLKKAQFSQQFYDTSKYLFSKMAVKNFLKMYPEEWAERINATLDNSISEEDAITAHKIATDLYNELLFDEKIAKKQKEYDELSNKLKKLQEEQVSGDKKTNIQSPTNPTQKKDHSNHLKQKEQSKTSAPSNISDEKQTEPDQLDESQDNEFWKKLKSESLESGIPEGFIDFLYELYGKLSPENFISTIKDLSQNDNDSLKKMIRTRQSEGLQKGFDDLSKEMRKIHDYQMEAVKNIR